MALNERLLKALLLQQVPFLSAKDELKFDEEEQQVLAKMIYGLRDILSGRYVESFLNAYFKHTSSWNDTLAELYLTASSRPSHALRYFSIGERLLPIHASSNLVEYGTTGAAIWDAAVALSDYLVSNPHIIHGKNVLELGSGTGLAGLVAHLVGADVTLSDIPSVLATRTIPNIIPRVKTLEIDWRYLDGVDLSEFDFLLASDVIFDPDLCGPLTDTMERYGISSKPAIIFQTIRNPDTFTFFLEAVSKVAKSVQVCPAPSPIHFYFRCESMKIIFINI